MADVKFKILRHVTPVGAFGMLMHPDVSGNFVPIGTTLEPVYGHALLGMKPKVPDGIHYCNRSIFYKHKYETYEVHVPGHTRILFHIGNYVEDTEGCILVGETFTDFDLTFGIQKAVIGDSGKGFKEFMTLAADTPDFFLEVKTAP